MYEHDERAHNELERHTQSFVSIEFIKQMIHTIWTRSCGWQHTHTHTHIYLVYASAFNASSVLCRRTFCAHARHPFVPHIRKRPPSHIFVIGMRQIFTHTCVWSSLTQQNHTRTHTRSLANNKKTKSDQILFIIGMYIYFANIPTHLSFEFFYVFACVCFILVSVIGSAPDKFANKALAVSRDICQHCDSLTISIRREVILVRYFLYWCSIVILRY